MPEFGGICSGDILVFEASGKEILQQFLPYVVQSNSFFDQALGTTAGSLSPRTKWQELAKYEFALPPLSGQRRISDVLRTVELYIESVELVVRAASDVILALLAELGGDSCPRVTLETACHEPITYGIVQAGGHVPGGVPYVRVSDMTSQEFLHPDTPPRTSPEIASRYRRSSCSPGDLIFALRGPIGLTRVVPDELDDVNLTQGTARLSPDPSVLSTSFLRWSVADVHLSSRP